MDSDSSSSSSASNGSLRDEKKKGVKKIVSILSSHKGKDRDKSNKKETKDDISVRKSKMDRSGLAHASMSEILGKQKFSATAQLPEIPVISKKPPPSRSVSERRLRPVDDPTSLARPTLEVPSRSKSAKSTPNPTNEDEQNEDDSIRRHSEETVRKESSVKGRRAASTVEEKKKDSFLLPTSNSDKVEFLSKTPLYSDDDDALCESLTKEEEEWSSDSTSPYPSYSNEDLPDTPSVRRAKFLQKYVSMAEGSQIKSPDLSDEEDEDEEEVNLDRDSGANKKFHKRFKNLTEETVIDDFLCALLLKGGLLSQGSMYITPNYVCFYSNIFGKKSVVSINFRDILSVRKCKILKSIPNSIEIHTPTKKYFWASFLHRDLAFQLIDSRWRMVRKKSGNPVVDELSLTDFESDEESISEGFDWMNHTSTTSQLPVPEIFEDNERREGLVYPPIGSNCSHTLNIDIPKSHYCEAFPISVTAFYHHFLSDLSEQFWSEFHSQDDYHKFSMSPWSVSVEGCCLERHVEFKAPIPLSLAPKFTRVTQQQRCRYISPECIVFETRSHSKDVPYANQFLVVARWEIKQSVPGNCTLNIDVQVTFTRKNWLKGMIERNAIEGSREWFESWIASALGVARGLYLNAHVPMNQRTPRITLLKQSIRHSNDNLLEMSLSKSRPGETPLKRKSGSLVRKVTNKAKKMSGVIVEYGQRTGLTKVLLISLLVLLVVGIGSIITYQRMTIQSLIQENQQLSERVLTLDRLPSSNEIPVDWIELVESAASAVNTLKERVIESLPQMKDA